MFRSPQRLPALHSLKEVRRQTWTRWQTNGEEAGGLAQPLKSGRDVEERAEDGLTIPQGFSIVFCYAFGAGIAFQGWYPKLAGLYGYPLVLLVVGLTAGTAENAVFEIARSGGATSFAELCQALPRWTRQVTPWCTIVWSFVVVGMYVQFVATFVNDQILERWGASVEPSGWPALPLFSVVGAAVFFVSLPTSFGGRFMNFITTVNFTTTWVVICTAVVKGTHTYLTFEPAERPPPGEYETFRPEGLLQVMVLVAGAMFQVVPVPRLNYELKPELRKRAGLLIPYGVASVQGLIFLAIGTAGYLALGNAIPDDGDVFAAYFVARPDWMTTVLQGGIALLMFLSIPLFSVTGKSELWGMISQLDAEGHRTPFEKSPFAARFLLNLGMIVTCTSVPMVVGKTMYMSIFTIASGTVAVWMNMFLPSCVMLWVKAIPARKNGGAWICVALKSVWILSMGCLAVYASALEVLATFSAI